MPFSSFGLRAEIVRAVTERGYTHPTPVQGRAIPAVMAGGDLMAGAQTGTGKTAGFTLPILHRLAQHEVQHTADKAAPRALILTPTRELAAQVEQSVRDYGKYLPLTSMAMFGGVNMEPQLKRLRQPVDVVVATPGRLLDHVQQKTLDLSRVEILVLDEADRMLDMGFIQAIRRILSLLPKQRQNLLFSATFSRDIKQLAASLLREPTLIEVEPNKATADLIAQRVYWVDRERKRGLLAHLIKTQDWVQVLVFTRTKHGADRLAEQLERSGITALAIHSNKRQAVRTRTLAQFKNGELRVLVATDIAARGIDISELPHVVNYDMPNTPEDYVHRIGRTGRAGVEGEAVSLVSIEEHEQLAEIEKLIKQSIPHSSVPGFEPGSLADLDDDEARAERRAARQQRTQARDSRGAKPRAGGERKPRSQRGRGGNRRSNGQTPRSGESTSR